MAGKSCFDQLRKAWCDDSASLPSRSAVPVAMGPIGKLGRDRVCAPKQGMIEVPSDILGVLWEELDDRGGWQLKLAEELKAAGYEIDLNKVTRG